MRVGPVRVGRLGVPLVLASASPQRRRLLRSMGLRFEVSPSGVPEKARSRDWRSLVRELALAKAKAVATRRPKALVVGSDTIVVCRGELLLKPRDKADARRILSKLNGRWQRVYTGVALVRKETRLQMTAAEVSRVKARKLPPEKLERLAGKHMDKAGAYAVQDHRDPFIERIVGPLDNVIGFPRLLFKRMLKDAGLIMLAAVAASAHEKVAATFLQTERYSRSAEQRVPPSPVTVAESPEARIARLRPTLERMGLEVSGSTLRWPGEPELSEPKLSACLDEVEFLSALPSGASRAGTENRLTDYDRQKLGARFFEPELTALGIRIIDSEGRIDLVGPGGGVRHGPLDGYLRALERAKREGRAPPALRAFHLTIGEQGGWQPAELHAVPGEHVSVSLTNARAASGAAAGFRLEGLMDFRDVPPIGATAFSFQAAREGRHAYYDPAFRERGEGALIIESSAHR